MEKVLVKLKDFLLDCGVFNMCRSFLKRVLSYNKVDKCCPLPYNFPSVYSANLTARHEVPSLRTDGTDGDRKCPLIFFILQYIKHYYSYILKYIYKKCPYKFLVGFKYWSKWGSGCKKDLIFLIKLKRIVRI